jgi:pimeloyl-ACP methyl ester carboxylesterase
VLYFHGGGDSRLTRHPDDSIAAALGVRLLSVDRSGPAVPGRTLVTWARDVEALADVLGLEGFAVVGSMPPPDSTGFLARDVRFALRASSLAPRFSARRLEAWGRRPTPPTGNAAADEAYAHGRVEAFRGGGLWLSRELAVLGRPWGFDLAGIRAPVTLWWGTRDTVCPPAIADVLAQRIPQTTLRLVDGTHQVLFTHWREILADVAGSAVEPSACL